MRHESICLHERRRRFRRRCGDTFQCEDCGCLRSVELQNREERLLARGAVWAMPETRSLRRLDGYASPSKRTPAVGNCEWLVLGGELHFVGRWCGPGWVKQAEIVAARGLVKTSEPKRTRTL